MRAALALAAGVLAGAVLGQGAPAAWAGFQGQASAQAVIGADVLAPPTRVAAASPCSTRIDVTWDASASDWLDGYELLLSTDGRAYEAVPLPAGTDPKATRRSVTGLDRRSKYAVVVNATRSGWRAAGPAVQVTLESRACR